MQKIRLMSPGPTPVPPEVTAEMSQPMAHHRSTWYRDLIREVIDHLQYIFCTRGDCLLITGSGTAAMEAAIASTCPAGEKILVSRNGKFSQRWAEIVQAIGCELIPLDLEWGCGAQAEQVAALLEQHPDIKTVVITHSETTTAAQSDLQAIAALTRQRDHILLVVDGITSVGAIPFKMDEWGVDVAVTGSQKALMTPPGLGVVAVNDKAWNRIDAVSSRTFYLDLKAYRKAVQTNDAPYTPAITLTMGLRKALEMIHSEGLENIWQRSASLAQATRAATRAMGLEVFAQHPVDSLTAIAFPDNVDVAAFQRQMREELGIIVSGGQGSLKNKIVRINHMGYVDETDTIATIAAMELTLTRLGHKFPTAAGTKAALNVLVNVD